MDAYKSITGRRCSDTEATVLGRNNNRYTKIGEFVAIIHYSQSVNYDERVHDVSITVPSNSCTAHHPAEAECRDIIARIFPELLNWNQR